MIASDNKAESKATTALNQLSEFEAGNGRVSDHVSVMMEILLQPNLEEALQSDCALDCHERMEIDTSPPNECEKSEVIVKDFATFHKEMDQTKMCHPTARLFPREDPTQDRSSSPEHLRPDAETSQSLHILCGSPELGDGPDGGDPAGKASDREDEHFEDDAEDGETVQPAAEDGGDESYFHDAAKYESAEASGNESTPEGPQSDAEMDLPKQNASSALSMIPGRTVSNPEASRVLYTGQHAQSIAWTEGLERGQVKDIKEVEVEHVYRQGHLEDTVQHQYLSSFRKLRTISLSSRLSKTAKDSAGKKRSVSYDVWEMPSSDEDPAPPSSQRSVLTSPSEQASKRVRFFEEGILAHSRYVHCGTQTDDLSAIDRNGKAHLVFHFPQKEKGQEIVFKIPVHAGAVLNVHAEQG